MCVMSMVAQHYHDEWEKRLFRPTSIPFPNPHDDYIKPPPPIVLRPVTQDEVDEFRRLLDRAREYDRKNNEPDCETEDKRAALKKIAEALGVDISFVDATA